MTIGKRVGAVIAGVMFISVPAEAKLDMEYIGETNTGLRLFVGPVETDGSERWAWWATEYPSPRDFSSLRRFAGIPTKLKEVNNVVRIERHSYFNCKDETGAHRQARYIRADGSSEVLSQSRQETDNPFGVRYGASIFFILKEVCSRD